ncbi:MAG: hypothetical protein ABI925_10605 [Verrucomicrobiota bacterium]
MNSLTGSFAKFVVCGAFMAGTVLPVCLFGQDGCANKPDTSYVLDLTPGPFKLKDAGNDTVANFTKLLNRIDPKGDHASCIVIKQASGPELKGPPFADLQLSGSTTATATPQPDGSVHVTQTTQPDGSVHVTQTAVDQLASIHVTQRVCSNNESDLKDVRALLEAPPPLTTPPSTPTPTPTPAPKASGG